MYRLFLIGLILVLPASAHAKKVKKATAAQACPKIVELRIAAYRVTLDVDETTQLMQTCKSVAEASTDPDTPQQLACAATALGHVGLWDCGDVVVEILKQAHPFRATMHKACVHQIDIAEEYAHTTLSPELKKSMIATCDQNMEMQELLRSPYEMETATKCMQRASNAAASERCWQ